MTDLEKIARLCHEVNRAYCVSLGDHSQLPWSECPEWQQKSVQSGVLHLMADPTATPEDSHVNWLKDKVADGWVYGAVKDEIAKTHPCMVPYDELPPEQRMKDTFFHTVVRTYLEQPSTAAL